MTSKEALENILGMHEKFVGEITDDKRSTEVLRELKEICENNNQEIKPLKNYDIIKELINE